MPNEKKYADDKRLIQVWGKNNLDKKELSTYDPKITDFLKDVPPKGQLNVAKKNFPGATITTPVVYENITPEGLNYYDRVARLMLAITHTAPGDNAISPTDMLGQQMIGAPTVAVAECGGTLYVTTNKIAEFQHKLVKGALEREDVDAKIEVLPDPKSDSYHAEMQLVDYFSHKGIRLEGDTMGVSKPCCKSCADRLEALSIDYSYWHGQNVGKDWKPCTPKEKWWKSEPLEVKK
ncbi:MAG TPA: hypothetical protein VGN52_05810 [Burkholderiales bacterium]|jgi:hypothetical protein